MSTPLSDAKPASAIVVGADGLIGCALASRLEADGCKVTRTSRRSAKSREADTIELDLTNPNAAQLPEADVAFLCAGMTKMSACRADPGQADLINHRGQVTLAEALSRRGTAIVYLSTSAVLDCLSPWMLAERPREARSIYGQSKSRGEIGVLAVAGRTSVVRLTKVIAWNWPLLLEWQKKLQHGNRLEAFADHRIAPITLDDITESLIQISRADPGIYQISGSSDVSYFDFAGLLAKHLGVPSPEIVPSSAATCGLPDEEITPYTSLDCRKLSKLTGFRPPSAEDIIRKLLPTVVQARH